MLGPLAMNLIPALVREDNWFRKNVIRFCPSRNHIGLNFSNLAFIGDVYKSERPHSLRHASLFIDMAGEKAVWMESEFTLPWK